MIKTELVVFDWDGTLVNSIAHIVASLKHAANALGLPLQADMKYQSIIGLGMLEAVEVLYPYLDSRDVERYRKAYSESFFASQEQGSVLYPHVEDVLVSLDKAGIKLAVATGKSREGLNRALEVMAIGAYFSVTRCANETRSKPHPLMLQEILNYCEVAPENALMVGDTTYDLEMAARAGVPSVGVIYGAHPADDLLRYSPRGCIDCLSKLSRYL
ncbi:MAG: HAD-IA family hydrolase [Hahellaceae bacterium]|nr:HAD-IA family hydrolase [Hahellaceae bacterium]